MIRPLVQNDPCENFKHLCIFFYNALGKIPNKIVRLPIIFLRLAYFPKLQSLNILKKQSETLETFNPNFLCFSKINDIAEMNVDFLSNFHLLS